MTPSSRGSSGDRGSADVYLPLAVRAEGLSCLIVGGGKVGQRKAIKLVSAGAIVTVVAPKVASRLAAVAARGAITWRRTEYAPEHLEGVRLVVAATDDAELNLRIGQDAEKRGIWACVASSAEACRVIFPAVWSDGEISVAVHSRGKKPRRSRAVRDRIAAWLSKEHACVPSLNTTDRPDEAAVGKVFLVGAGPGASDLITLRGLRAMQAADAILVDQLVPAALLADLGIASSGKRIQRLGAESPRWSQDAINRWLVEAARAGQTVVRLKGGDPLVFGRGDTEIEHLVAQGIPWEVIPGPSSATAVLSAAGLPVTRRGRGRSFAVATARLEGGRVTTSLPRADSLVILMAVAAIDQVVARLLADGWPPQTPALVIERGTLPWERRAAAAIDAIASAARDAKLKSPALLVVGEAAERFAATADRPTILFTGLDPAGFRGLGNLLHWPAQMLVARRAGQAKLRRALTAIGRGDIDRIVFADKFAVTGFCAELADCRIDARSLRGVELVAVGPTTAERLAWHGLVPDATVPEGDWAGTVAQLANRPRRRVLLVQGSHSLAGLRGQLKAAGASVVAVALDRLVPHPELGRPLPEHDVAYFVSPAGVRALANAYGPAAFSREAWCLGRATQAALADVGATSKVVRPIRYAARVARD